MPDSCQSPSCYGETLRHIITVAQELKEITRRGARLGATAGDLSSLPPHLSAPPIPDITPQLACSGLPNELVARISVLYQRFASELWVKTEAIITRSWTQISSIHHESTTSELCQKACDAQVEIYGRHLESWVGRILQQVQDRSEAQLVKKQNKVRRPFNFEYVPLLEYFFNENPFPSHADKTFLAKKTGMTFNQIHVWFQNHRNRMKGGGKSLKKKPMHEAPKLPIDDLIKNMGDRIICHEERRDVESESSEYELQHERDREDRHPAPANIMQPIGLNVLDSSAPPHAFPTAYPPPLDLKPFPVKDGIHNFPTPVWMRLPAQKPLDLSEHDFHGFIEAFGNLNVRQVGGRYFATDRCKRQKLSGFADVPLAAIQSDPQAATAAITTRVCSAPLQSYIETAVIAPCPLRPLPVVAAPIPCLHPFRSPSPQSQPTTLIPPSRSQFVPDSTPVTRKIAPLPKRIPASRNSLYCGVTPAASDLSTISSLDPSSILSFRDSRTPSLGSEFSLSRTSRSSSYSDIVTPDSPRTSLSSVEIIRTPLLSLPEDRFSLQPNLSDLFGDTQSHSPSPVRGRMRDYSLHKHIPPEFTFSKPNLVDFGR